MPNIIRSGGAGLLPSTLASLTAEPSHVLTGKVFLGKDSKVKQTGTMANKGALSQSVAVGGTVTGTAGYYSSISVTGPTLNADTFGNATAGNVLSGKTFTSSAGVKVTGTMTNVGDSDYTMASNRLTEPFYANGGSASNPYAEIVTPWRKSTNALHTTTYLALKIPSGRFFPSNSWVGMSITRFGAAAQTEVLSGKTFTSSNGILISGSMTNRGAVSQTIAPGGSYTVPAGYHNGSGKVTAKTIKANGGISVKVSTAAGTNNASTHNYVWVYNSDNTVAWQGNIPKNGSQTVTGVY